MSIKAKEFKPFGLPLDKNYIIPFNLKHVKTKQVLDIERDPELLSKFATGKFSNKKISKRLLK